MLDYLQECRENFGEAPRTFSWWDRLTYLRVPSKPAWLKASPDDKIMTYFDYFADVMRDGKVVWGHVIQANYQMFEPGPNNCPGEMVYALDTDGSFLPATLRNVAIRLGELKGTDPEDSELAPIADYLTDEMIRVFGLKVPSQLSPRVRCRISTVYFIRKHLLEEMILQSLIPLVVLPQKPFVATVLPEQFWPDELVDWWVD